MAVHEHKQCHFCSEDLPFPHPAVRRGKCGYKLAAELQSRLSHVSCRALTWEGAAEAMPARMSRCCLRKIFSSPYKEILKAKYFSSNLGNWSGSIFRLARVCEGLSSFFFDLLSHGECSQSVFHAGLLRRTGWEPRWHPHELQCVVRSFVCSQLRLPTHPTVLNVNLLLPLVTYL